MTAQLEILSRTDFNALDPKTHRSGTASARIDFNDEYGITCIVPVRQSLKSGQIFVSQDNADVAADTLRMSGKDEAVFRLHFDEDSSR